MEQNEAGAQQMTGPHFIQSLGNREWREDGEVLTAGDEASAPTGDPPV